MSSEQNKGSEIPRPPSGWIGLPAGFAHRISMKHLSVIFMNDMLYAPNGLVGKKRAIGIQKR